MFSEVLAQKLRDTVGAVHVEMVDTSADRCGHAFEAVIVSPEFEGKALLARHRMVNEALKDELAQIHAFSQKTFTPSQWEARKTEAGTS
jgi:stress-induced morphogen